MCPPCSPADPCPCSEGWVCREDPEHSRAQRRELLARQQVEARQRAQQNERQRARAEAERQRILAQAAEEQRLAEGRQRAEEAERARARNAYPAPQGVPSTCDQRCPGRAVRWTRFTCATADRRDDFYDSAECPAGLPAETRGCPVPWQLEPMCVPAEGEERVARCHAGPRRCCLPDGTIIRPCGPIPSPGCTAHAGLCGSGGFCTPCR